MSRAYNAGQGRSVSSPSPVLPGGPSGLTLTMSLVREYRNIQSKVMLSFSRMSCRGSESQLPTPKAPPEEECRGPPHVYWQNRTRLGFILVPPASPHSCFTIGASKRGQACLG